MPRPPKLNEDAIAQHLATMPNWEHRDQTIVREFKGVSFVAALGFVNAVGILSEVADHHPDIVIHGWNKVRITLSTHDQGGLTELDFALAKKIDDLKF